MAAPHAAADAMTPYQLPQPPEALKEIVVESAIPKDERLWVPQAENVWFRPLCLNVSPGYWMNLLRVRKSGVLSRHRHPQAVHGMVLKGRWRYLEHDWIATEGSYVYEPPGETHTLYVADDVEEMITLFQVNGVMFYGDPKAATPATKTSSRRSTCAASISKRSAWARITSISSSARQSRPSATLNLEFPSIRLERAPEETPCRPSHRV